MTDNHNHTQHQDLTCLHGGLQLKHDRQEEWSVYWSAGCMQVAAVDGSR